MYNLIIENKDGKRLNFSDTGPFTISEIEGLSPPAATANLSDIALTDGQKWGGAMVRARTLNISFVIQHDAEKNRIAAYNILRVKKPVKIYYKSDFRDVFIEGYVVSVNVDHFSIKQICTMSIICPAPYFKRAQETINELSVIVRAFHFPFNITKENTVPFSYVQQVQNVTVKNGGEVDTGLHITLYAKGEISNPKIYNYKTGEFIGFNLSMQTGDEITINTMPGEKTATLLRDGVKTNIFNSVMENSKWLGLEGAEVTFVYEIGGGNLLNLDVLFAHNDLYEGV